MLKIQNNLNLKDFSTLKVGQGVCHNLYEIESLNDFEELKTLIGIEKLKNIFPIGEGSNTVFVNDNRNLDLLKVNFKTIDRVGNILKVGAGVNWDLFVQEFMKFGTTGIEYLSAIPGTVGASPVQNIGAYGKEVSEFIYSVEVYDKIENTHKIFKNSDCNFKYRDSIFKQNKSKYIIFYVNFVINIKSDQVPEYKDIKNYLYNSQSIKNASDLWDKSSSFTKERTFTNQEIRNAVVEVRKLKLPNPTTIPNCGSFFKNIIINNEELLRIKEIFPEIPVFTIENDNENIKIPTAYIIEKIGLKGINIANFGIHKEHALVIVSNGLGNSKEFLEFIEFVKQKVYEATKLNLVEEVNLV